MRELVIMPGVVVTMDVTSAPVSLVCMKVEAAIRHKLFKVLALHIGPEDHVEVDIGQCALLDAALKCFNVPLTAHVNVI